MANNEFPKRIERGNQVLEALKTETDRGRACVGDALLDEVLKDLFRKRLAGPESKVEEVLGDRQLLGSHGGRLTLASLLGWLGPETHADCRTIHKIRNRMAHELDVDSFDHSAVRDLIDQLESPRDITVQVKGAIRRAILNRQDKFLFAVQMSALRLWRYIDIAEPLPAAADPPIERS